MFIVFEGTDGAGTSTQAKRLSVSLQNRGYAVEHTTEPSLLPIGQYIDTILKKQATVDEKALQLLFFADRFDHLEKVIFPALRSKKIVICERYLWSTISYGIASGVSEEMLRSIAAFYPPSDCTFFLSLEASVSLQRVQKRGAMVEHFENTEVLSSVFATMHALAKESFATHCVHMIDANDDVQTIAFQIEQIVTSFPVL